MVQHGSLGDSSIPPECLHSARERGPGERLGGVGACRALAPVLPLASADTR